MEQGKRRRQPKGQLIEAAKKKKWDIVRGDKVQVVGPKRGPRYHHPEEGKQGIVKKVLRDKDRVIVGGVNMGPKHIKGNPTLGIPARVIQKERTIHYSKVSLLDPVDGQPCRFYKKYLDDGTKVRVSKRSGAVIPKPESLKERRRPVSSFVSDSDTIEDDVWEVTYVPPGQEQK